MRLTPFFWLIGVTFFGTAPPFPDVGERGFCIYFEHFCDQFAHNLSPKRLKDNPASPNVAHDPPSVMGISEEWLDCSEV